MDIILSFISFHPVFSTSFINHDSLMSFILLISIRNEDLVVFKFVFNGIFIIIIQFNILWFEYKPQVAAGPAQTL